MNIKLQGGVEKMPFHCEWDANVEIEKNLMFSEWFNYANLNLLTIINVALTISAEIIIFFCSSTSLNQ
jgi:hypothetical protein